jgi:AraC-like DNA-binding protein
MERQHYFNREFWDRIEWESKQDIQIAEEVNRSRERVRQVRIRGGYPECQFKRKNRARAKFERTIGHFDVNKMTIKEIADITGRSPTYVSRVLNEMGLKAKPSNVIYSWEEVNWRKGNKEIAAETGASTNYVSRQRGVYAPDTVRRRASGGI